MDDAKNEIHSAFFCDGEGTLSSLRGVAEAIEAQRFFCELRTDRGGHRRRTAEAGGRVERTHRTQLTRAMDRLGVHMEPAYSPEARGCCEQMFGTLQGRLPQELALAGVTDMDEANAWLWTAYLPRHNKRLTRKARLNGETAFIPRVDRTARDGILCESHERGE